jgi:hypothetical protein
MKSACLTGRARDRTYLLILHIKKSAPGTYFDTGTYFHEKLIDSCAVSMYGRASSQIPGGD